MYLPGHSCLLCEDVFGGFLALISDVLNFIFFENLLLKGGEY